MPTEVNSTNTSEVIQINNKIRFERKANQPDVQDFRICAVEFLDKAQWAAFTNNMLNDYDFIDKHSNRLCVGSDNVVNALLVVDKQGEDGILVNSEGSAYARYSAYLPFAGHLLDYYVNMIADYCVTEGTLNTSDGAWAISFDELYEHHNEVNITEGNGIDELVLRELQMRDEVAEAIQTEDGFEITYHLDYCPKCNAGGIEAGFSEPKPDFANNNYKVVDQDDFEIAYAKHILWLNDIPGGKQLDMSGCHLEGVNLSNRKLLNANFSDALLVGVKMDSAELCFANFSGAFLDHCSMQYANADEINFRGATLKESDLSYILLYGGNFAHATFYKSDLFNCNIGNTCFEGTRFVNTPTSCENIDLDFKITDADWVATNEGQVMQ